MGNSQSPPADPRFATAVRAFSKQELDDLKSLFVSLTSRSQNDSKFVPFSQFQAHFGIKGALGSRMFDLFTRGRKDGMLTFEDLVIAKAVYEKGTRDEIEEFIYELCDVNGDGILDGADLQTVLGSICDIIFSPLNVEPGSSSHQDITEVFLNAAMSEVGVTEVSMTLRDFKNWCRHLPSVRKFLGSLLMSPDSGRPGFQVPHLQYPENLSPDLLILKKEYAWHIGGALSQQETEEWKLLYHSATNGLSFNTFMGNISSGDGPTVLVIKDSKGYIYGGYASQPWERKGDFYGDMKSFLFQLYPKASIPPYRSKQ
ncbi:TLD domain-containing protein 1 isoform X1 [Iris pallida]|uniref:TLD domain-containing protein 1 isoform X1 n=1 Tax=Iris pallida TaxID=29817 RepID=A0AAX6FX19_IRIPA|nr:TLD domain-containing protein 1 isoform X1 [Iris pallida]